MESNEGSLRSKPEYKVPDEINRYVELMLSEPRAEASKLSPLVYALKNAKSDMEVAQIITDAHLKGKIIGRHYNAMLSHLARLNKIIGN